MRKVLGKTICAGLALWIAGTSYASVIITGTRVIYPSEQRNVNVQLSNTGDSPALIQAWIDDGDSRAAPDQVKTPFVITPPISRIEKQKGQTLRITYTGEALPTDRESLFYFNVLDIPPKPTFTGNEESQNYLQIAVRSRLKLFFRPAGLAMPVTETFEKVQWRLQNKKQLIAHNPTPYFITFNKIEVGQGKQRTPVTMVEMIAPFSDYYFELQNNSSGNKVYWTVINDYGGKTSGESPLNR